MEKRGAAVNRPVCVVDCSYVAAFFLGEPEGQRFGSTYKTFQLERSGLQVPCLFPFELMNVIVMAMNRNRISPEDAIAIRQDFQKFQLIRDMGPSAPQVETIYGLALRHKLTFYDASYLELAIRLGAELRTLDHDLLNLHQEYPWISDT